MMNVCALCGQPEQVEIRRGVSAKVFPCHPDAGPVRWTRELERAKHLLQNRYALGVDLSVYANSPNWSTNYESQVTQETVKLALHYGRQWGWFNWRPEPPTSKGLYG